MVQSSDGDTKNVPRAMIHNCSNSTGQPVRNEKNVGPRRPRFLFSWENEHELRLSYFCQKFCLVPELIDLWFEKIVNQAVSVPAGDERHSLLTRPERTKNSTEIMCVDFLVARSGEPNYFEGQGGPPGQGRVACSFLCRAWGVKFQQISAWYLAVNVFRATTTVVCVLAGR